jgi:hypothetical protein
MAGRINMGVRGEGVSAVAERYRSRRAEKGRILDEWCAMTGWHRKLAVRAPRQHEVPKGTHAPQERSRMSGATIKNALTAVWASDRVCGKRLKVMIPTLIGIVYDAPDEQSAINKAIEEFKVPEYQHARLIAQRRE